MGSGTVFPWENRPDGDHPPVLLLPPVLWQGVPFGDKDAFLDWNGHHQAWHQVLAKATQTQYLAIDDLRDQLLRHSQMHAQLDLALGIPSAYDLVSYDLNERSLVGGLHAGPRRHASAGAAWRRGSRVYSRTGDHHG